MKYTLLLILATTTITGCSTIDFMLGNTTPTLSQWEIENHSKQDYVCGGRGGVKTYQTWELTLCNDMTYQAWQNAGKE